MVGMRRHCLRIPKAFVGTAVTFLQVLGVHHTAVCWIWALTYYTCHGQMGATELNASSLNTLNPFIVLALRIRGNTFLDASRGLGHNSTQLWHFTGCDFTSSLPNICNNTIPLYFCHSPIISGVAIYLEKKKRKNVLSNPSSLGTMWSSVMKASPQVVCVCVLIWIDLWLTGMANYIFQRWPHLSYPSRLDHPAINWESQSSLLKGAGLYILIKF